MKKTLTSLLFLVALIATFSLGNLVLISQEEGAKDPQEAGSQIDPVSEQAAPLEGELGKYKPTTPEAAEVMVKLIDLYHEHGRVFGLIRVAQTFVATQPNDARHQPVMLKLIDGLQVMSRNKDLIVACRQYLERYASTPQVAQVEIRLTDALMQTDDLLSSAKAAQAVWKRQGPNASGRRYGIAAINYFCSRLGGEHIKTGADLAAEIFQRLPNGTYAREVGRRAYEEYYRSSQWASVVTLGGKLVQRNQLEDNVYRIRVLSGIAYAHGQLQQYRNAATAYQAARNVEDRPEFQQSQIAVLNSAQAKPADIENLANQYIQKNPTIDNRFGVRLYVAQAYEREMNTNRARDLYRDILYNSPVDVGEINPFITLNGTEPAQIADSEKHLRAALAKQPLKAYAIRYYLAFGIARDRQKDIPKSRQLCREFLQQSPGGGGWTDNAIAHLLTTAANDNEFRADVRLALSMRRKFVQQDSLRTYIARWISSNKSNKELRPRLQIAAQELAAADKDVVVSRWQLHRLGYNDPKAVAAREELLLPGNYNTLTQSQAREIAYNQAYYYRHYAPAKQRAESATRWAKYVQRFGDDQSGVLEYFYAATDYAEPEVRKLAATQLLRVHKTDFNPDWARRLMQAADVNDDPALLKQAYQWLMQWQAEFKKNPQYAALMGDILLKHKLEAEATALWTLTANLGLIHADVRDCAGRLLAREEDSARKVVLIQNMLKVESDYHGRYTSWLANEHIVNKNLNAFGQVLAQARTKQDERPDRGWDFDYNSAIGWLNTYRTDTEATDADRSRVYTAVKNLQVQPASAVAELFLLEMEQPETRPEIDRLLVYQRITQQLGHVYWMWDPMVGFAQSAMARKDHVVAAALATGMLANMGGVDDGRQEVMRKIVSSSYARMGGVGLTIDESSPLAPLLQSALYLRLGDTRLAFDTFDENRALFDEHRNELPVDLIVFVCDTLIAASGDENHNYVEEVLRGWMVQNSESAQIEDGEKAQIQLLLGKNFYRSQRYDIARGEYLTVINRYPETPEAIDAEFGVGETFLAQKVYDQAEQVFEKLSQSTDSRVIIRSEFLRGVLAFRRGDRDDARDIFRSVLERVPDVDLANQTLYNLAEVYRIEERYIDQLNLLRTVGRLGQTSKRRHRPGDPLSIVVHDSDLGISRGHSRIPVIVSTEPGGDRELVYLTSSGAGKGLFRVDLNTQLGDAQQDDRVLQLTGIDIIRCDYPDEFKADFKNVPLSDVEIRMAANADFKVASSQIQTDEEQTFSQQLQQESGDTPTDSRVSQIRPENEIKPGNPVYLRIEDHDRDISSDPDTVLIRVGTDSGDEVQVIGTETGAHTGIFEASVETAELPAGALASDTAIDHSPLMAIDRDRKTSWRSQPDGQTPKFMTVDMKDLFDVSRVRISTPSLDNNNPLRGQLQGSYDGEFWFRLASYPAEPVVSNFNDEIGQMTLYRYAGNYSGYTNWNQVQQLFQNTKPVEQAEVDQLSYEPDTSDPDNVPGQAAAIWYGKIVQPVAGAVRFQLTGTTNGLALDGLLELAVGRGNRSIDVWLTQGVHELTVFTANANGVQPLTVRRAHAQLDTANVNATPFVPRDFDLTQPAANVIASPAAAGAALMLTADQAQLQKKSENFAIVEIDGVNRIQNWLDVEDFVSFEVNFTEAGVYQLLLDYGRTGNPVKGSVEVGQQVIDLHLASTGAWTTYQQSPVGHLVVESVGPQTITIRASEITSGAFIELRGLSLQPMNTPVAVPIGSDLEFRFPRRQLRYTRLIIDEYTGDSVILNHIEVGDAKAGTEHIPTDADVLSLASNNTLEIAAGDNVTATYTDEFTQTITGTSRLLTRTLTATYNNGTVAPIAYDYLVGGNGVTSTRRKALKRVDPGDEIVVEIVDYDRDETVDQDKVDFQVQVNDEPPIPLIATETDINSGTFTRKVLTSAEIQQVGGPEEEITIKVAEGDQVYLLYTDRQNTFPGHSVPRRSVVYVNQPTDGQVRVLASRVTLPPEGSEAAPQISYAVPAEGQDVAGVALTAPLTIEVIDPDAAKDSESRVIVAVKTSSGATVNVECVISSSFGDFQGLTSADDEALEQGRFVGQLVMQLGGPDSPPIVPIAGDMPRSLIGRVRLADSLDDDEPTENTNLVTRVLHLTGQDIISSSYQDTRRTDATPLQLEAQGRLLSAAELTLTDREYEKSIEQLHVGERLYVMVSDADQDVSDDRDSILVTVTSEKGEQEIVSLSETTIHSGIFTGSFELTAEAEPTQGNLVAETPELETYFGDLVSVEYTDPASPNGTDTDVSSVQLPVVVGTDGLIAAFSKTFNDENLAVETKFRIAESYFELFKSHSDLGQEENKTTDLQAGRRILREVMEDYPDPKYAPRVAYLLGQFSQELQQWSEAIRSYEMILTQFPDHSLAPDAQYKLAQCHEESGNFDEALEAYVTLAATHPKSPLIANVMIRIADYFYQTENFVISAQVGEKFLERFDGHQFASRMAFRVGQCYYKDENYGDAGSAFDKFAKLFPEDALGSDALFWAGESYRQGTNNREAFRRYNRCRWDFPASEAAKYARGRLALPEMLQQFEAEAASIDNDN